MYSVSVENTVARQPFTYNQTDGDGRERVHGLCIGFLYYFAVSLCATESLYHGHAVRKYRAIRSRTAVCGYSESRYSGSGSHFKPYPACWHRQPGGCGIAEPVPALRMRFIPERPVPVTVTRLFELPVQISLPIYSLERPANPQPLAYLVLQADSYRMYKFVMSALATLVTAYLLLVLMLTVALTWCINRLMVRPLRRIARELNDLSQQERLGHQLTLPRLHHDDEIGMLVRSYNRNQQSPSASMMSCPSSRPASRSPSCRIKPFAGDAGADGGPPAERRADRRRL